MRWSAVVLLLLTGCFHQMRSPIPRTRPAPLTDTFVAPTGVGFVREPQPVENEAYSTERVRYPAHRPDRPENAMMQATLRIPNGMPRGLIVVLPILGGDYGPSDTFAHHLAAAGFTTLRFDRKAEIFDPKKDFVHVESIMREGVIDVRRAIGWAKTERLAGRGRIGLVGISMGSFVGTIVTALDLRVDAAALALGGAGLPSILEHAESEQEVGALFAALRAKGWSDEQITEAAERDLASVDPSRFAAHLPPATTLLIHARFDAVVPFDNGNALYVAAGRPERIVTLTGHYSAVLVLPQLLDAIEAHFTKHLDPRPNDVFSP